MAGIFSSKSLEHHIKHYCLPKIKVKKIKVLSAAISLGLYCLTSKLIFVLYFQDTRGASTVLASIDELSASLFRVHEREHISEIYISQPNIGNCYKN